MVSDDGWTWRRGDGPFADRRGAGCDPHRRQNNFMYIARGYRQPKADVTMIWSTSLDPNSRTTSGTRAESLQVPTVLRTRTRSIQARFSIRQPAGCGWCTGLTSATSGLWSWTQRRACGKDPKVEADQSCDRCEASDMFYHDGWYYLLATHGSCCAGASSGYNIRMGRSRHVTGPYLDAEGVDMIQGGGTQLIGSGQRKVGPGHFGLMDLGDGIEKFSMHWEADLNRGGASILDIRPLLWKDGWPVAGENPKVGVYEIKSVHTATSLAAAVEGIPVGGGRMRAGPGLGPIGVARPRAADRVERAPGKWRIRRVARQALHPQRGAPAAGGQRPSGGGPRPGGGGGMFGGTGSPIADQTAASVDANWPKGDTGGLDGEATSCRRSRSGRSQPYRTRASTPALHISKITIAGTDRTLTATAGRGAGGRRCIVHRRAGTAMASGPVGRRQLAHHAEVPGWTRRAAWRSRLWAQAFRRLSKFNPKSDMQHWLLKTP